MKKIIILIISLLAYTSCKSQSPALIDISNKKELNYIIANIDISNIKRKSLYNDAFFITIFQMYDSKINYNTETDERFISFLISISPDGDYYTKSKLLKIEKLINPHILNVQEEKYPIIYLEIEYGNLNNRKTKLITINLMD